MLAYLFTLLLTTLALSITPTSSSLLHTINNPDIPTHVQHLLTRPSPTASHQVLLTLSQADPDLAAKLVAERSEPSSAKYLQWLDRQSLGALLAGLPDSTAAVHGWLAAASGVTVSSSWGPYVQVTGSVSAIERLFNTTLGLYYNTHSDTTSIRQTGSSYLPNHLDQHIANVDGLHTGDIVSPIRAIVHQPRGTQGKAHSFKPQTYAGYYTSAELSSRYGTPNTITATATNTGSPTSVSVIQLSDSENYDLNALTLFGRDEGFAISDLATLVTAIQLISPHATNTPTTGANDESMLDLEAVASITTTSKLYAQKVGGTDANQPANLFGYFASASPLPQVMSLSYSYAENQFAAGTLASYERQVQNLVAMGVTFLAASGDSGYNSGIGWPATSAYVLAVGGTHFAGTGSSITETAWSGSTGGISSQIARPSYQTTANTGVNTAYRTVPDVSALADTWFLVYGDQGSESTGGVGGTSLASPLWAGVITYLNVISLQYKGTTLGFVNPLLYSMAANCPTCFHDITSGTSNGYSATTGYDLVTGLGSPNLPAMRTYLIALLTSSSSSTAPGAPAATGTPTAPAAAHSSSSTGAASSGTCSLTQATAVGYFGSSTYSTVASASSGALYTVPVTLTSSSNVVGLGLQQPAASGAAARQTSVIQLALYQASGSNTYSLVGSTAQQSITGAGGSHTYSLTSAVTLAAGTYYVGVLVKSTGSGGVLVYANTASTATIGPDYSTTTLPSSFTTTSGNYPFRVEILKC